MVFDNDGMIEGYYSYEMRTGEKGERELHIREFFAAEDAAFRGLLGYLAAQNEANVIEYLAPPDTPLRHALRQPIADDAQNRGWVFNDLCHVTPGPMGRIINLPAALTALFSTTILPAADISPPGRIGYPLPTLRSSRMRMGMAA